MISPYESYVYAYPHKTAYRPLDPRPELTEVWRGERAGSFYAHIPFLRDALRFLQPLHPDGRAQKTWWRPISTRWNARPSRSSDALDPAFTTAAIGGGTPTYLSPFELGRLFDITGELAPYGSIPLSVETSPATATADRLAVLKERGATRVSIGVQSFLDEEARSAVRPQKLAEVEQALDAIRATGFPILNIDLIYGIDGQTASSWLRSADDRAAVAARGALPLPAVRPPLTGLGKIGRDWDDQRMELYREGRDFLLAQGYEQVSMRMFRLPGTGTTTDYCCQTDGMASVGCGARSYTSSLHYSHEYAVGARHVRSIIDDYVRRDDFTQALIGFPRPGGRAAPPAHDPEPSPEGRPRPGALSRPLRRRPRRLGRPRPLAGPRRPGDPADRRGARPLRLDRARPVLRRGPHPHGHPRRPMTHLTILYRGPLASCDYDCAYCPFAKRRDTPEQLRADRAALRRFTEWTRDQDHDLSVLFTPWGEGLVRSWYREAMVELSHRPNIRRVAIQTNLSTRTAWLDAANPDKLALWVTYHPTQIAYDRFLAKVTGLKVRHSVGVVGDPAHLDDARRLRADLPAGTYLWINAEEGRRYTDDEAARWQEIDPLFHYSRFPHLSAGQACRTGDTVISSRRRRHGPAVPLHPDRAGQPLRRHLPGPARPEGLPEAGVRLPHRLRPPRTDRPGTTSSPAASSNASPGSGHRALTQNRPESPQLDGACSAT